MLITSKQSEPPTRSTQTNQLCNLSFLNTWLESVRVQHLLEALATISMDECLSDLVRLSCVRWTWSTHVVHEWMIPIYHPFLGHIHICWAGLSPKIIIPSDLVHLVYDFRDAHLKSFIAELYHPFVEPGPQCIQAWFSHFILIPSNLVRLLYIKDAQRPHLPGLCITHSPDLARGFGIL